MTEIEMRDYIEQFWNDGREPIFSAWDERTENKQLLCASHDEAVVTRYILTTSLCTQLQKQSALQMLEELSAEEEETTELLFDVPPTAAEVQAETFLVTELDWDSLSSQRREELLAGCGYWGGMSKEPWDNMLRTVQVLLARELERISGGMATFVHNEEMEELRHEPGWEEACDPRLTSEAGC